MQANYIGIASGHLFLWLTLCIANARYKSRSRYHLLWVFVCWAHRLCKIVGSARSRWYKLTSCVHHTLQVPQGTGSARILGSASGSVSVSSEKPSETTQLQARGQPEPTNIVEPAENIFHTGNVFDENPLWSPTHVPFSSSPSERRSSAYFRCLSAYHRRVFFAFPFTYGTFALTDYPRYLESSWALILVSVWTFEKLRDHPYELHCCVQYGVLLQFRPPWVINV